VTLYWGLRLLREPANRFAIVWYALAGTLLFYTHYLSALAVVGGLQIWMLARRRYIGLVSVAIMMALYAPWQTNIVNAVGRVARVVPPAITPNPALEQGIRLAYLATSFTIGETPPWWAPVAGVMLALPLLLFLLRAKRPEWLPPVLIAAGIG